MKQWLLKRIWAHYLLIFLLAVAQYLNTASHDYAWDDAIVITTNTRVQKGLKDIPDLFRNIKTNETQNRYGYRPIALLSFATDIHFFGMNPKAAHVVNIILYGLLCALVLLLLNRLFPKHPMANLLVSLIFALHPIHTEVVANIKSRDEILALAFGILSILAYVRALKTNGIGYYLASLLLLVLGFLSKESAITLLGVAFVLPWAIFESNSFKQNLKKSLPLIGFFGMLLVIRYFVYSDVFYESNDFELVEKGVFFEDGYVGNPVFDASGADRVATAIFLLVYFIYRFGMPYPLLHDYSFDQFAVQSFNSPLVWVSIVVLVLLLGVMFYGLIRKSPVGLGLVFFFATSSVYLHLVQPAPDIFAERFVFTPSLGICIALLGFASIAKFKRPAYALGLICLVPFFVYGTKRNADWADNETLLKSDLPHLENCVRANYNYALFLHGEYYKAPDAQKPYMRDSILKYYEQTMNLTDRLFNVYFDLGAAYMEFGYPDKGYQVFKLATERFPKQSTPWVQMGKYYISFKEYSKAIPYLKRALKLGEKNSDYNYLLAICLFNSGWYEEAIETMLEGEQHGVSSSAYHLLLSRLYVKLGDESNGLSTVNRGLQLFPNDASLLQQAELIKQL